MKHIKNTVFFYCIIWGLQGCGSNPGNFVADSDVDSLPDVDNDSDSGDDDVFIDADQREDADTENDEEIIDAEIDSDDEIDTDIDDTVPCEVVPLASRLYRTGEGPQSAVIADFDGDEVLDVAVGTLAPSSISIFHGLGDGTIELSHTFELESYPQEIVAVDFDGDGDSDIATSSHGYPYSFTVAFNAGDGTFPTQDVYDAEGGLRSIAAGDIDSDGDTDLLVADDDNQVIRFYFNDGDGVFAVGPDTLPYYPFGHIRLGDADGDGDLDVFATDSRLIIVSLNDGTGSFPTQVETEVDGNISGVAIGDTDGDGDLDAILTIHWPKSWLILSGNGDGSFSEVEWGPEFELRLNQPELVDLNADGHLDSVFRYGPDDELTVWIGNGDGTFGETFVYPTGNTPMDIAIGDLDSDGFPDFALPDTGIDSTEIVLNRGGAQALLLTSTRFEVGHGARVSRGTKIFDANLDGHLDIVAIGRAGREILVFDNRGDSSFEDFRLVVEAEVALDEFAVGDFDGDGSDDLLILEDYRRRFGVSFGNGDGTFTEIDYFKTDIFTESIDVGDIDGDGDIDAVFGNSDPEGVAVSFNDGSGTFGPLVSYSSSAELTEVMLVELNGDGALDLVSVARNSTHALQIRLNDGVGNFGEPADFDVLTYAGKLEAGDIDGDGDNEILLSNSSLRTIQVFFNRGDGTFDAPSVYETEDAISDIHLIDFDLDGNKDLIVAISVAEVWFWPNDGSGEFLTSEGGPDMIRYAATSRPEEVTSADLNSDGWADLVVTNSSFGSPPELRLIQSGCRRVE